MPGVPTPHPLAGIDPAGRSTLDREVHGRAAEGRRQARRRGDRDRDRAAADRVRCTAWLYCRLG